MDEDYRLRRPPRFTQPVFSIKKIFLVVVFYALLTGRLCARKVSDVNVAARVENPAAAIILRREIVRVILNPLSSPRRSDRDYVLTSPEQP